MREYRLFPSQASGKFNENGRVVTKISSLSIWKSRVWNESTTIQFSFVVSGIFRLFVTYWVKPVPFAEGLNIFSIFFTSQLILLGSITQWKRLNYDGYVYPDWAQAVAWLLALCSFVAIPVRAISEIVHHTGSFREVRSKLFLYYLFQYIIHSKYFSVSDWLKSPDTIWISCSTLQRLMKAVRADVSVLNAVADRHNLRPQR